MIFVGELPDGQATIWCKNIPEKLNPLSRVHARHRRQTDRRTDGFAMPMPNVTLSRLANNHQTRLMAAIVLMFYEVNGCVVDRLTAAR